MSQTVYAAYIGIDWYDRKHDIYLYDCTGEAEESVIGSQPEAIQAWVAGLRKQFGDAILIDGCFTALPDADWFTALPGAGEHLAPRLLQHLVRIDRGLTLPNRCSATSALHL